MTSRLTLLAALALSLSAGGAFAQATAPAAPAAPAMAAPAATAPMMKKGQKPRTAQSLECSKKANAADVHGKLRSAYMRKCKDGKA